MLRSYWEQRVLYARAFRNAVVFMADDARLDLPRSSSMDHKRAFLQRIISPLAKEAEKCLILGSKFHAESFGGDGGEIREFIESKAGEVRFEPDKVVGKDPFLLERYWLSEGGEAQRGAFLFLLRWPSPALNSVLELSRGSSVTTNLTSGVGKTVLKRLFGWLDAEGNNIAVLVGNGNFASIDVFAEPGKMEAILRATFIVETGLPPERMEWQREAAIHYEQVIEETKRDIAKRLEKKNRKNSQA